MKIGIKIFLVFAITGVILTISGVSVFYLFLSKELENNAERYLKAVATSRANHIKSFIDEKKEDIEVVATHQELTNEELEEIKNIHDEYYEIFVLDPKGTVIASSNKENIGLDFSSSDYFINARREAFVKDVFYSEITNIPSLALSAIQNGNVVVSRVSLDFLSEITLDENKLEETGEVYLVNENKKIITPSRFVEDAVLNIEINTIGTKGCFSKKYQDEGYLDQEVVKIYNGYGGGKVMGTSVFIPEMNWCLLAEIDEAEALGPLNKMLAIAIVLSIVIILAILIIALKISRTISDPIKKLYAGSQIIAKGNLDYRVENGNKDEIGQLAQAFNEMVLKIKKSYTEINKRVKVQTKKAVESEKKLSDQQKAILNVLEDMQIERDLVQKEKNRIRAILQGIGDGVFFIDEDFNILIFNPMAEKISGFSSEEAVGERYDRVLKFINRKTGKVNNEFIKDAFQFGKIATMKNHTELIRKDGSMIPVADSAAPLKDKDGNVIGCVVVFRDVTKEREVDKAKTEFVSLASHQLRTPLSTIKWYLEVILDEAGKRLSEGEIGYLKEVYNSNERMINLVGSLLNVSRIEMGTFAILPRNIDFRKLVEQSIAEVLPIVNRKKIKIIKRIQPKLPNIKADSNLLKIVLDNLLTNAVKYTPEKGTVSLMIKVKDGKNMLIKVSDTGYGIPENQQKKVFEKLFRADNIRQMDTTGTGLGLYIAKAIVEKSGGKIWFDSALNKGTNFYFTIPLKGMLSKKGAKKLI